MRSILLSALLMSQLISPAIAADWKIDDQHSQATFSIRHMMVSNVRGSFSGITGSANYDGKNTKDLAVEAVIDAKTVNTNEPARDEHLRGEDFFDVAKFPTMTFKSKKVIGSAKNGFKLVGDLTMHGVTKEVTLDVDGPSPVVKDQRGTERMGASATTTLSRKDFGIQYNKVLETGGVALSDDVKITLDIELTKQPAKTAKQ